MLRCTALTAFLLGFRYLTDRPVGFTPGFIPVVSYDGSFWLWKIDPFVMGEG